MESERNETWRTAWVRGYDDGVESVLCDLLRKSEKLKIIKALFGKTSYLEEQITDPLEKAKMDAYSEGFRHCINILKTHGSDSLGAYNGIINPSIKIELTAEDVKKFS